jgi:hypothetical protein
MKLFVQLVVSLVFFFLFGFVVQCIVNMLFTNDFLTLVLGADHITYGQSLGLMVLGRLISK